MAKKLSIEDRVANLEEALMTHLSQSGEIQKKLAELSTDQSWIKKGVWAGIVAFLTFNGSLAVALIIYLLRR
jgi:hypothetical protein